MTEHPRPTSEVPTPHTNLDPLVGALKGYVSREVIFDEPDPAYSREADMENLTNVFVDTLVDVNEQPASTDSKIFESHETRLMSKDKRVLRALVQAAAGAILLLSERTADKNRPMVAFSPKDLSRARDTTKKIFDVFGASERTPITIAKRSYRERPVFPHYSRALDASEKLNKDPGGSISTKGLALMYLDIDISTQRLLDKIRQSSKETEHTPQNKKILRSIETQAKITSALYMQNLVRYFENNNDRRSISEKAQSLRNKVIGEAKNRREVWNSDDANKLRARLNGAILETLTLQALQKASSTYGWSKVRRATPAEDVSKSTDIFIKVDGKDYQVDVKTRGSFRLMKLDTMSDENIKLNNVNSGRPVIVVNVSQLGQVTFEHGIIKEFLDSKKVATSVNQAIQTLRHRNV